MLYQIHRYPADLIDVVKLGDGQRVVVRPVLPQDKDLTGAFFSELSGGARYNRFMTLMREVPGELLERFTHVDYADHLALVATTFVEGEEHVIAEARYARGPQPASAEFAVSVAEAWQGRGLASLMLSKLACRAASAGVRHLRGETLATNAQMVHLARKAEFTVTGSPEIAGLLLLAKELEAPQPGRICSGLDMATPVAA